MQAAGPNQAGAAAQRQLLPALENMSASDVANFIEASDHHSHMCQFCCLSLACCLGVFVDTNCLCAQKVLLDLQGKPVGRTRKLSKAKVKKQSNSNRQLLTEQDVNIQVGMPHCC